MEDAAPPLQTNVRSLHTLEGRTCRGSCGQWKAWSHFDKKAGGKNGHDSRCKKCISKAKVSYKSRKIRRYTEPSLLVSKVIGVANEEKIDLFAKIIATSIMSLIEEGVIK